MAVKATRQAEERGEKAFWRHLLVGMARCTFALSVCTSGCITSDGACDPHQFHVEGLQQCVCEEGYGIGPGGFGCVQCREHQVTDDGVCVCEDGFVLDPTGEQCLEAGMGGLGAACTDSSVCSEAYGYCAFHEGEAYCTTQGCTQNDDCPPNWRCVEDRDGVQVCAKPPSGLGAPCEAAGQCDGFVADYCDTSVSQSCFITGCLDAVELCPSQWVCCDFTLYIGDSLCVPREALSGGNCPDGRAPVAE